MCEGGRVQSIFHVSEQSGKTGAQRSMWVNADCIGFEHGQVAAMDEREGRHTSAPEPPQVQVILYSLSSVSMHFAKLSDLCAPRDGCRSEIVNKAGIGWAIGVHACGVRGLQVREHT